MNKKFIAFVSAVAILLLLIIMILINHMVKKSANKLEMTTKRIDAIYEYGKLQYEEKDYDRAIKAMEIIAKEKQSGEKGQEALLQMADMYIKQNDLVKARDTYKRFIELFPSYDRISDIQTKLEDINMQLIFSPVITDDSIKYEIKPNDTLSKIAKEHGTTVELLKKSNNLKSDVIIPGKSLKVVTGEFSILIDKSQNLLFLKKDGNVIKTYKVSTGENNCTPVGAFEIQEKLVSPVWYKIGAVVPPDSTEYELGTHWMGLSVEGYGIHGTRDPRTIGNQITKGCVRMLNKDVEELYSIVPSGTKVVIVD